MAMSLFLLLHIACCHSVAQGYEKRSLAGRWRFQMDPDKKGQAEEWFAGELEQTIKLPGSMPEQGYGHDVTMETPWTGQIVDKSWFTDEKYEPYRQPGNIKAPFWLTPVKHYVGPAWYQKEIAIGRKWNDKRIVLFLERCHWETRVWVDGRCVGSNDSLSTPHEYDLGVLGQGKHNLTICVDNAVKIGVGVNAHSVSDHTQSNWNGIIGDIELRATDSPWIENVQIYPDLERNVATVHVEIAGASGRPSKGVLTLKAASFNAARRHKAPEKHIDFSTQSDGATIEVDYEMGDDVLLWDEFSPNLYRLTASIEGEDFEDKKTVTFGMRQFGVAGTQFTLNGHKTFLRGTLECSIFPLTGYPPTNVKGWRKVLKAAKAHGLNHLRFHSWCPPEAAFTAADEMGMIFQVECAAWTNSGPTLGDGQPIDKFIYTEGDRILKAYGNHPSFCMLAYGNEPAGRNQKEYLGKLVNYWKQKDPRRLYTSGAGWPIIGESDFHSTPTPRGHQWGARLRSRFNAHPLTTNADYRDFVKQHNVPAVSHEIGQWCVYPNFDEIKKYKGVLKAKNFEIFRESLTRRGMLDQAHDFLIASGKWQTLLYKEEIEAALRTPGFGGFQLLDLHDFPGQGTALVGVLDPFWEYKGYVKAHEYHRFCSETVPLLRMSKCVWTNAETFEGQMEIAHFGPEPIENAFIQWEIAYTNGRRVASGRLPHQTVPVGNGNMVGGIECDLSQVKVPAQLVVTVDIKGTDYSNAWDIWVYPSQVDTSTPDDVLVATEWNGVTREALEQGRKVMLMPGPQAVDSDVPPGFTTIFWNTQWTGGQPPHTLGLLCDPKHAALASFPTQFHSNWQWWDLVSKSKAMILDDLDQHIEPIVQVIDDWNTNRKLALVFEARVGKGRLLVCSIDLQTDLDKRPVARQMLHSLLGYVHSSAFRPKLEVEAPAIGRLLREPSTLQKLGAKVIRVDSEPSEEAPRRQGRYLRLAAVQPMNVAHRFAAVAELDIITD